MPCFKGYANPLKALKIIYLGHRCFRNYGDSEDVEAWLRPEDGRKTSVDRVFIDDGE
jgi:hypothetical protein